MTGHPVKVMNNTLVSKLHDRLLPLTADSNKLDLRTEGRHGSKLMVTNSQNASDSDKLRVRKISTCKHVQVRIIHGAWTFEKNLLVEKTPYYQTLQVDWKVKFEPWDKQLFLCDRGGWWNSCKGSHGKEVERLLYNKGWLLPTKKYHAQPKGEKKKSCPRKLPSFTTPLKKIMFHPWILHFSIYLITLQSNKVNWHLHRLFCWWIHAKKHTF